MVGTFLGGVVGASIGDWLGKALWKKISGQLAGEAEPPIEPTEGEVRKIDGEWMIYKKGEWRKATAKEKQGHLRTLNRQRPSTTSNTSTRSGGVTNRNIPPHGKAFLEAIAGAEGWWDSVNPRKRVKGLETMTFPQARKAALAIKGGTSAMGRYQNKPTYNGVNVLKVRAQQAGLNYETAIFSPENQNLITWVYAQRMYKNKGHGDLEADLKAGKIKEVAARLGGIWPSLPGGSQQNVHTKNFYKSYDAALKKY